MAWSGCINIAYQSLSTPPSLFYAVSTTNRPSLQNKSVLDYSGNLLLTLLTQIVVVDVFLNTSHQGQSLSTTPPDQFSLHAIKRPFELLFIDFRGCRLGIGLFCYHRVG